jgi:mRNA interferase MazF
MVNRFEVHLVNLDAEPSGDAKNTRPCVVISPNEMNHNISTAIIAPISSSTTAYPTRVQIDFLNNRRSIVLDQIRTVDQVRLVKKIGEIEKDAQASVTRILKEMFDE